jgi:DNA-binding HxlR family transcriptional regulator
VRSKSRQRPAGRSESQARERVCPHYHAAVELIGRRWTGAILAALTDGPLRFAELAHSIPGLSDRLLSQRLKELEGEELVERAVHPGSPVRVEYTLTEKGTALEPTLSELRRWAQRWNRPPKSAS